MTRNRHDKHIKPPKKDCPVPCFVSGSVVLTKSGLKLVQDVVVGDKILTMDNGYHEVAWAGKAYGNRYVKYNGSSFSPQHRILVRKDNEEVFISAKHLVKQGDAIDCIGSVEFVHFMFDRHQVVNVDGIWSESFYPGECIMNNLDQADEIYKLFPDLSQFVLARETHKVK